jgi:hypothetical protein
MAGRCYRNVSESSVDGVFPSNEDVSSTVRGSKHTARVFSSLYHFRGGIIDFDGYADSSPRNAVLANECLHGRCLSAREPSMPSVTGLVNVEKRRDP